MTLMDTDCGNIIGLFFLEMRAEAVELECNHLGSYRA